VWMALKERLVACRIETNSMWGRLMRYAFYFRDDRDNC
jgi:hypothetical protein